MKDIDCYKKKSYEGNNKYKIYIYIFKKTGQFQINFFFL